MPTLCMRDYLRPDAVGELCREIAMPDEAVKGIVAAIETCDYSGMDEMFCGLFSLETGNAAVRAFQEKYRDTPESFKALAAYLAAALHTRELYARLGVPQDIFRESVAVFARAVNEHRESYGFYGFNQDFWIFRMLSANLFRLGVLEYEIYTCPAEMTVGEYAGPGDAMISVHIPSDAVMTRQALDESYAWAKEFFAHFFPNFHYKRAFTDTWLLSPALKDLLPPTSRILEFQSDYEIIRYNPDGGSPMQRIFKNTYEDLHELPEHTTLQRNAKQFLLGGGKIGDALGVLKGRLGVV